MLLDVEKYKKILKAKYASVRDIDTANRYLHSLSVGKKAVEIVNRFNLDCDIKKIEIAGILHDYAKFENLDRFVEIVSKYNLNKDILNHNFKVLHALLGPYIIHAEIGLADSKILNAIKYHATGSLKMDIYAEVIYVSDVAEDLREGSGFDQVKEYSKTDFRKAIIEKIEFSLSKHRTKLNQELYKKYTEVK